MRRQLFLRLLTPIFAVSGLLLFVGIAAAWIVHQSNQSGDPLLFASPNDVRTLEQTQQQLARELQALRDDATLAPEQRAQQLRDLEQRLQRELLQPLKTLISEDQAQVASSREQRRVLADRIGLILIIVGTCGAIAGLLSGYFITNAVARSIAQLDGVVAGMVTALRTDEVNSVSSSQKRSLPELQSTVQLLADRTATVVQELHSTRLQAERSGQLAALGQLAAGLAHELRNPLTAVKLLVQVAQQQQGSLGGRELAVLMEEVERLEKLLQTFLDYARPPNLQTERVDLIALMQRTLALVSGQAEHQDIELRLECLEERLNVDGDSQQLRQVLLNLLLNAIEAMPSGGLLTLTGRTTEMVDISASSESQSEVTPQRFRGLVGTRYWQWITARCRRQYLRSVCQHQGNRSGSRPVDQPSHC